MTDDKDTAAKIKPLISKENAQNRPETIQRGQVLGVSAFREHISNSAVKRRWPLCPVCRNTSRENGRSFLMSVAGRNTTRFAGNAKGAASRASVPSLFTAHIIYRKGEQDNDRLRSCQREPGGRFRHDLLAGTSDKETPEKQSGTLPAMTVATDNDTPALDALKATCGAPISMGRGEIPVRLAATSRLFCLRILRPQKCG